MSKQYRKKKKSVFAKILQSVTTILLVLSTLICFFVVVSSTVNQDVSLFGFRLFYVVTGSMEPTIPVGSLLIVGECDTYEVNEVITFYSNDESIQGYPNTHRIIEIIEEDGVIKYVTQGDANDTPDEPVAHKDVIGKVYYSIDNAGLRAFMEFLGTPIGFFAVILLPILLIALVFMKDFGKAMKEEIQNAALDSLRREQVAKGECHKHEKSRKDRTK